RLRATGLDVAVLGDPERAAAEGGEVVEVTIFKHGSQRDTPTYSAHLHYLYVFQGVVHRGSRALGGDVSSRANAERFGAPYVPGRPIDVFVDARRPHRHTLHRGLNPQYWWLVGLGLFWLGAAGWVIVD
ncbi:MAG: DUF3592 domain-containing protein, partial [Gammaproteobacteria bacterium]